MKVNPTAAILVAILVGVSATGLILEHPSATDTHATTVSVYSITGYLSPKFLQVVVSYQGNWTMTVNGNQTIQGSGRSWYNMTGSGPSWNLTVSAVKDDTGTGWLSLTVWQGQYELVGANANNPGTVAKVECISTSDKVSCPYTSTPY